MKKFLSRIFVDSMNGMVMGIFVTLVIGTILKQVGTLIGGQFAHQLIIVGNILIGMTGAAIGCGIATSLKENTIVVIAAAISGMIGAYANHILAGVEFTFSSNMNLLVAFLAAYVATEMGHLLSGKTKLDLIVVPVPSVLLGCAVALITTPFSNRVMIMVKKFLEWGMNQNTFLMGACIAVLMCVLTVLPLHMAAVGALLAFTGKAAGAATIGCCVSMIGFAVASYKDNGMSGLVTQGLGSSILQLPNIIKKPIILLPTLLTSGVLGAIATLDWFGMTNTKLGAVMGSCGLIGQLSTYQKMIGSSEQIELITKIAVFHFILPGILCYVISEFMRKNQWIKNGDMKISL